MRGSNKTVDVILHFLYPKIRCPVCLEDHGGLCITCREHFRIYDKAKLSESDAGVSVFHHEEYTKTLISNYKKKMIFSAADTMAEQILVRYGHEMMQFDFITYAPSSKGSIRKLGFDHGKLLASLLARKLGLPVIRLFVPAVREQKILERDERKENAGNIRLLNKDLKRLAGRRGLIIDDVYTTGSTVAQCLRLMSGKGIHGKYVTFSRI